MFPCPCASQQQLSKVQRSFARQQAPANTEPQKHRSRKSCILHVVVMTIIEALPSLFFFFFAFTYIFEWVITKYYGQYNITARLEVAITVDLFNINLI